MTTLHPIVMISVTTVAIAEHVGRGGGTLAGFVLDDLAWRFVFVVIVHNFAETVDEFEDVEAIDEILVEVLEQLRTFVELFFI